MTFPIVQYANVMFKKLQHLQLRSNNDDYDVICKRSISFIFQHSASSHRAKQNGLQVNTGYYAAFMGGEGKHYVSLAYLTEAQTTTGRLAGAAPLPPIPLKYLISSADSILNIVQVFLPTPAPISIRSGCAGNGVLHPLRSKPTG